VAWATNSFVALLALLLLDYVALSATSETGWAVVLTTGLLSITAILAVRLSGAGRTASLIARSGAVLAIALAVAADVNGGTRVRGATNFAVAVLVLLSLLVLIPPFVHLRQVSVEMIFAAICTYVLIGLVFTSVDQTVQQLADRPFFAQAGTHGPPEFVYFSFITLTTTGFGDLTPASGLPRSLTVLEALIGQIFLVALVAYLVSLYSITHGRAARGDGDGGPDHGAPPD
jgi:hypothetical protein